MHHQVINRVIQRRIACKSPHRLFFLSSSIDSPHEPRLHILPNKDLIAQPSQGPYFALTKGQVVRLLGQYNFSHSEYYKRIDLIFKNPKNETEWGIPLVTLHHQSAFLIDSFDLEFRPSKADELIARAFAELAIQDRQQKPDTSRRISISFRAYLSAVGILKITRRVRKATMSKHSFGNKFSNSFKPRGIKTDETLLHEITLL